MNAEYSLLDAGARSGIQINYKGAPSPLDSNTVYLQVKISCDSNTYYRDYAIDDASTPIVISFYSSVGCPVADVSGLWSWISSNQWVMFAIFLIVGAVICFLGRTLFKPVLFIAGLLLSVSLVWLIFYSTFLSSRTEQWVGWVVLACSLLLGLIIGVIFVKLVKLGVFVIAAWGGFSLGILTYNAFGYYMHNQAGFWCLCIAFALIFGILSVCFFDHILIHATAMAGSFLVINGIGLVAGRYQNPFTLATYINSGVQTTIDPIFYAYLAGNLVLYILGCIFQYRQKNHDKHHGKDPYERLR